jgi:hypothetical protein
MRKAHTAALLIPVKALSGIVTLVQPVVTPPGRYVDSVTAGLSVAALSCRRTENPLIVPDADLIWKTKLVATLKSQAADVLLLAQFIKNPDHQPLSSQLKRIWQPFAPA